MLSEIFCGIFPLNEGAEDGKVYSTKALSPFGVKVTLNTVRGDRKLKGS